MSNKDIIAKTLTDQARAVNLFARRVHNASDPHDWEQRYNKHIAKLRGMLDMAENFGYYAKFDYKDDQGFYAEITGYTLILEHEDGTPLSADYIKVKGE